MNKKPKVEQFFILLTLFTGCFILIAAPSCKMVSGNFGPDQSLWTCGGNGCITCSMTCGTMVGGPYWDCSKLEGCLLYHIGCLKRDDKTITGFYLGCGSCLIGKQFAWDNPDS